MSAERNVAETQAHGQTMVAIDVSLDSSTDLATTLAAPLPHVDGEAREPARGSTHSVLPRLEPSGDRVRLVPPEGPRYSRLRPLGTGAMGEVALVEDHDIGRRVAMKRLLDESLAPPQIARFVDEVRTVGRLEHPNIVPIHDVGVDENGRLFFVMKYIEGETLEHVIERLRAGDPEAKQRHGLARRVEIFQGLLRALQYAHAQGIVHRDVKPANVMVGTYGEVVLMDWGIARPLLGARTEVPEATPPSSAMRASSTHAGVLIGTPLYMSPEQAAGKNDLLDARSDLFSAAVLFHELLGLEHRHAQHATVARLLLAIMTEDPPGADRIFPGNREAIPAEYGHFLRRALQRDPDERWQSASVMLDELERILEGRCRVQCPVTLARRASSDAARFFNRSPFLAYGVIALVGLGVLALAANAVRDLIG